ncbi:hypothetical protein SGPA1_12750 [Streptomyces misionensis JCM 4497]
MPREPPVTIATRGEPERRAWSPVASGEVGMGMAGSCGGWWSGGRGLAVALLLSTIGRFRAPSQGCVYPGDAIPWLRSRARVTMEG